MFELHPQLAADCETLGRFDLCRLLLMNDANYPWCILVPERAGVREIYELAPVDQQQLLHESSALAAGMARVFNADKMNIAALGNVVPQLHVHHIVRYTSDPSWPAPVWGKVLARPYASAELQETKGKLRDALLAGLRWEAP
jgi:diadenosine tetraphosphate (Ap4A) HIT family hydrolase